MALIRRAMRTPYFHLTSQDGSEIYMRRYWLFNPYGRDGNNEQTPARIPWLPSIRIHHIMRPDTDRDLHDHPWNARTLIIDGWYKEQRMTDQTSDIDAKDAYKTKTSADGSFLFFMRRTGYTGRLQFGQYHRIDEVPAEGVWTIFITGRKRGTWGFDVNGRKVLWRDYLGL